MNQIVFSYDKGTKKAVQVFLLAQVYHLFLAVLIFVGIYQTLFISLIRKLTFQFMPIVIRIVCFCYLTLTLASGSWAQSYQITVSHHSGVYQAPIYLNFLNLPSDWTVYYTRNGATPTKADSVYSRPIFLNTRADEAMVFSLIPTNNLPVPHPYREHWTAPEEEVQKINVIRARAYSAAGDSSEVWTGNYLIDPKGQERYSMPWISLASEPDAWFGHERGIYVNGATGVNFSQRGREWERPLHFFMMDEAGNICLNQEAGVRIHGGTTRGRPRKSLRLYARDDYGQSWFDYPLFPEKPVSRHKRFLLRNSGNDWSESIFRDAFMQRLMQGVGNLDLQYSRPAIVFLNGEYWGIHNIRDRMDQRYLQAHYNLDPDSVIILDNNGQINHGPSDARLSYFQMLNQLSNLPSESEEAWIFAQAHIDITNFIDYQLLQLFVRNTDWPGNNISFWRSLQANPFPDSIYPGDGRWRWMTFDLDFGFQLNFDYVQNSAQAYGGNNPMHNTLAFLLEESGPSWPNPAWSTRLFRTLIAIPSFRERFIVRATDLLNTAFEEERVGAILDEFVRVYTPEMSEHIKRWREPSMAYWESDLAVMEQFGRLRARFLRGHFNTTFDLGGSVAVDFDINQSGAGYISMNTIQLRPGEIYLPEGSVFPWKGLCFKNTPLVLKAVPNPGFVFSHWEGSVQSTEQELLLFPDAPLSLTAIFQESEFEGDLMNPPPHLLREGSYFWGYWSPEEEEGSFPAHMVFQQANVSDPLLRTEMSAPYHIPFANMDENDYHPEDLNRVGFPYSLTRRTRINALGDEGISLINTGRSRDLGAVVLALDTRGVENVRLNFLTHTREANSRVYNLRLQYRIGTDGPWADLEDTVLGLIEHNRTFAGIVIWELTLPAVLENKAYVQLRWKYYFSGIRLDESSGQRDEIRLDNISVRGDQTSLVDMGAVGEKEDWVLNIFPNPGEETLFVQTRNPISERQLSVTFYNALGKASYKTVIHTSISDSVYRVPIPSDLPPGVYIVQIEAGHQQSQRVWVKK